MTVAENQYFLGSHYSAYTYCQRSLGNFVHVVVEETWVGDDSVSSQSLDTSAALEARERFVECYVTVRTDTAHEQVYTTCSFDSSFVSSAFCFQVFCITIEDVYVFLLDVDVAEEVVPHEWVVAFWMIFRKTYVFVHVESNNIFERYLTCLVQFNQSLVHAEWRRTSRATEDEWLFRSRISSVDFTSYIVCSPLRNRLIVVYDNYSHSFTFMILVN